MDINSLIEHDDQAPQAADSGLDIRHLSEDQLMKLGVSQLAYVKPVMMDGSIVYAIHAADGSMMAVAAEEDLAVEAIRQHEMLPAYVH